MTSELSLSDFYPQLDQSEAEAPEQSTQKSVATQKSLQKFTFQERELQDIEAIKELLLQHKTQQEISQQIGCTRVGVNKKIAKWSQTEDFKEWLSNAWIKQYNEFSLNDETKLEAFKQLTRWMCALQTRKYDVKSEVTEHIEGTVNVNTTIQLLREYADAFNEATVIETAVVPANNIIQQVDNPKAPL